MQLCTLGKLEFRGSSLDRPQLLLLLAYLSIEGGKSRHDLSVLFHIGTKDPMASLRVTLSRTKSREKNALTIEGKQVTANISSDAKDLLEASERNDFGTVISLYKGPFLEGFFLKDCSIELEEWVYTTREHLAAHVRQAYINLAEIKAKANQFNEAASLAEKALHLEGAAEPKVEHIKQLYKLTLLGQSIDKSKLTQLAQGYGIQLRLSKESAQALYAKDKQETATATNLSSRNNAFFGRQEELELITELLNNSDYRLISLHGSGGIGKTRLLTQIGLHYLKQDEAKDKQKTFPDGIFIVKLESLTNVSQIPSEIAHSLNLSEANSLEQLANCINQQSMLLLMDNYEHLAEGAMLCSDLLNVCPNLKILTTTRERLNTSEEVAVELGGLKLPEHRKISLEEARTYDSIKLFEDRAKYANVNYNLSEVELEAIIHIAQLTDGLPLGIELAAASVSIMNPQDIANAISHNLDNLHNPSRTANKRQQSIRATFEYSWNLLSPQEQESLKNLTVFAGGFTRQAAQSITTATLPTLRSLIDKSLIKVSSNFRYSSHMLLNQFCGEVFNQDLENKQAIEQKHAAFYTSLALQAEAELIGKNQLEWFDKLELEKDNLRKALGWNLEHDLDAAFNQAAALRRFWETRGYLSEGRAWLFDVLKKATDTESEAYLKACYAMGVLTHRQKGFSEAQPYFETSKTLAEQLKNKQMLADATNYSAGNAWAEGNLETAHKLLAESIELKREQGDERGVAVSLSNLGMLARDQEKFELAHAFYNESLAIFKQIDDQNRIAQSLKNLGMLARLQGNITEAKLFLQQSLEMFKEQKDKRNESATLSDLGYVFCFANDVESAMQVFQASLRIAKQCEAVTEEIDALRGLALASYLTSDYKVSQRYFTAVLEKGYEQKQNSFISSALEGLACNQAALKNYEKAALTWGVFQDKASPMAVGIRNMVPKLQQDAFDLTVKTLGKTEFTRLLEQGKNMNPTDILNMKIS